VIVPAQQAIIATAQQTNHFVEEIAISFFVTTAVKSCSFGNSASTANYDSSCNNKQYCVREEPSPGSNDTVVESVIALVPPVLVWQAITLTS